MGECFGRRSFTGKVVVRAGSALALVCLIILVNASIGLAASGMIRVILSDLPAKNSRHYQALVQAAGRPMISTLETMDGEVWAFPSARLSAFTTAAKSAGVSHKKLGENWKTCLRPPKDKQKMSQKQNTMMSAMKSSPAYMGMTMMALPDAGETETALLGHAQSTSGAKQPVEIQLPLRDDLTVTIRRTSVKKNKNCYIWHGVVAGTDDPVTLLWWPTGRMSGQVRYQGHVYNVKPMGGAMHGVVEISPTAMPPEHAPMAPALMKKMKASSDPFVRQGDASMMDGRSGKQSEGAEEAQGNLTTGDTEITLLVAYTKNAASHYSDIKNDLIALAIAEANQSFAKSGIGKVKVKLVDAYETDYVEEGSHFEHVFRMVYPNDGFMDEAHGRRDAAKADIGLLIVDDSNGCGLAATVAPRADRAFAVVHHECAATSYSLAHEIGHILGARHNFELDSTSTPFPFGHGFVRGNEWRTMMSYEKTCGGCERLPIWSNPRIRVRGSVAGNQRADNARVIEKRAAIVASFR